MPLYDNPDQHGADPIAYWLDTPRGDKTHRQRFANLARAFTLGLIRTKLSLT